MKSPFASAVRMTGKSLSGVLLFGALTLAPAHADPVGQYTVEGRGPDGGGYSGVAVIEPQGDAFKVTWVIAREKFVGTAVGNENFFAVAYRSGSSTGIAVYGKDGDGWLGAWTYTGGTKIGTERLTRR